MSEYNLFIKTGDNMLALIPSWANKYFDYWDTIRMRNLWLIKLRYGAVAMLFVFLVSSEMILNLHFDSTQRIALTIINAAILGYNIILHWTRKYLKCIPGHFNPLHFSLVQMFLDLTALGLIVYFTGSIETPLFMLFIFHMIIGSLILPGRIIYAIAGIVIVWFNSIVFGEYLGFVPHHAVMGLLAHPLYKDMKFIMAYDVVFSFAIIISVLLTNKIANQLYSIEQQLVDSFNKLEEAEKEKQKYIIGLVHEIKSPLAVVHSYLELILQKYLGPLSPEVEDRISRATASSGVAITMINNVLKVSNLRLLDEITVTKVDMKKIISVILTKYSDNIKEKEIKLTMHDFRDEERIIKGDEMLLDIAFSNLIGNAIKYVNLNGAIEIMMRNNYDATEIEISDNGIGIPEKDLEKIFNDFYRASNIKQKKYEGSGLGLSIVKHIIERHGGTIEVKSPSRLGTGSNPGASFFITLKGEKKDKE